MGFSSHSVVQQVLATTLLLFITLASTKDIEIDNAGGGSTARKAGGAKKTGLFQRISRALDTGSAMDDDGTPFTDEMWEATRDEGEPVDPALMDFKNPVERTDAWKFDDGLKMLQTSMDGDLTNPVRDLVNGAKDLHAAWAVPHVFRALVTQVPLFQAFKPIQEIIKDKSRDEDYSPEDGVKAAGIFKSFMLRSMDVLDTLRDPEKFAAKLQGYAESKDKTLLDLFAKASRGEDENHKEINNFFMRQELGDVIDLDFLGFSGVEPSFLPGFRNQVKEFAPNMYNALMTDPNMKKYMEDPFKAVEEGKELLRNFQNR